VDEPQYRRIGRLYQEQITEGTLKPGDTLPSAREMSRLHGASVNTTAKVAAELQRLGLVRTRPGLQTIVIGPEKRGKKDSVRAAARNVLKVYQTFLDDDDLDKLRDAMTGLQEALDE